MEWRFIDESDEEGKWRLMRKVEIWRKKVYIQEGEVESYGGVD